MIAVSDIAPGAQNTSQPQGQSQIVESVIAQQKVIAAQKSDQTGDAGSDSLAGRERRNAETESKHEKDVRERVETKKAEAAAAADAAAKSVIEARGNEEAELKIKAAFQSRRDMGELLSVIRDPEDRVLPKEPQDLQGIPKPEPV